MSKGTTQRDILGRFLRLAEFGDDTPYEDLYQKAGGTNPERDEFIRSIVRRGYIELSDEGTVQLTQHGRQASRRLMRKVGV